MLNKEELTAGLKTELIGKKMFVFDSIDSTNECTKTLAEAGTDTGAVVIADYQTSGKGRLGRTWTSEPGKNLLFSVLLRPNLPGERASILTSLAAVSVARGIESVTRCTVECKWPNDLMVNGRKCCGVLVENSLTSQKIDYSIVGVGVNVNQTDFDTEFKQTATSLALESRTGVDRRVLFQSILLEFDQLYASLEQGSLDRIFSEWRSRCSMLGKSVRVSEHGEEIRGTALRVDDDGSLVVQVGKTTRAFHAGDVTVLSISTPQHLSA